MDPILFAHSLNVPGLCFDIWPGYGAFETKHVAEFLILIAEYIYIYIYTHIHTHTYIYIVLLTGINSLYICIYMYIYLFIYDVQVTVYPDKFL